MGGKGKKIKPFLACGVPDLGLDDFGIDVQGAGGELDANGGLGLQVELVLGEAREEVGLAHAGVADEDHLEEVVVVVVGSVTRHWWSFLLCCSVVLERKREETSSEKKERKKERVESVKTLKKAPLLMIFIFIFCLCFDSHVHVRLV